MFLAHLSRRLMGELIVYQSLRRPPVRRPSSVCQHFQTSSPFKPLGQLNSNSTWNLLTTRERKFVQMVMVTWRRWPPRPYVVKPFKNLLLQNQKADDLGTWCVALGGWAYQVCSNNESWLTLTYLTSRSSLPSNAFKGDFFFEKLIFENC